MNISRRLSLPGRFIIFWLLCLMYPVGVFASHPLDSLENVLPTLKLEQRVDAMNELATQLRRSQPEKALQYAQRALAISDSCHYTRGIALSNQTLGVIYYTRTDFQLAQTYHREALRLFQALGDRQNLARELRYLGMVEVNQSRYQSALDRYEQALKIFKELKSESGAADCYGNIATVYNFLGDYQKAIQYSFKSLEYREKTGDKAGVGFSYNSIGFLYTKLHKYVYALSYLEKSLQTAVQNKDQIGQIFPLINMGEVYRVWGDDAKAVSYLNRGKALAEKMHHQSGLYQAYDKMGLILRKQGQLEKALHLQLKALAICEELKNKEGLVTVMNHIGAIYSQQHKYQAALGYYQGSLSLAQDIQSKPMIKECYLAIAQASYRLNDFAQSARYYELYQGTQDTLFNEITERVVAEIQQKYEAEKKASEIRIIQQEKEIKELALEKAHTQRNMLLFIVCLGIIILILAVYLYLVKHRSNEELRSVNGRLSESEAHLQQINQTKDKLFSIVAHDLRGPINSLSALLQMQAEYPDSFTGEELKGFLHKMNGSVKNLSSLLDNLLHWSLAQMGHIEFAPEPLQLETIVENNFRLLEESARTKGVYLKNDLSTQISVSADRNMVDIVLRNLINNAIKFSHKEGHVWVQAQTIGKYAHISISDQGVGIPADRLATLFHQRQTHSTRGTGNEAGTGLGLLLCQEFVERCGGNIQVKSEVNEGTTFTFTLPMN